MARLKTTPVVTAFVTRDKRVLLLKRSSEVGSYQGHWAGVSGFIEQPSARTQAMTEINEELAVAPSQISLEAEGDPLTVVDEALGRAWEVHPFLFALQPGVHPQLDYEHVDSRWVAPNEITELTCVPGLYEAWCRVADRF